jgi:hypothetical protein
MPNAHQADIRLTMHAQPLQVECAASKLLKRRLARQSMYRLPQYLKVRNPTVYFLKKPLLRELNYIYFTSLLPILLQYPQLSIFLTSLNRYCSGTAPTRPRIFTHPFFSTSSTQGPPYDPNLSTPYLNGKFNILEKFYTAPLEIGLTSNRLIIILGTHCQVLSLNLLLGCPF